MVINCLLTVKYPALVTDPIIAENDTIHQAQSWSALPQVVQVEEIADI